MKKLPASIIIWDKDPKHYLNRMLCVRNNHAWWKQVADEAIEYAIWFWALKIALIENDSNHSISTQTSSLYVSILRLFSSNRSIT